MNNETGSGQSMQFSLEDTNAIQLALAAQEGGDPMKWIEEHSTAFRNYVIQHPESYDVYIKDPHEFYDLVMTALGYTVH